MTFAQDFGSVDQRSFIMLSTLLIITIFVLLYFVYLGYKAYRSEKTKRADKDTQMGFMVNTFQELVQKLKEKERELEEMRRLAEERAENIESYNENILQSVPSGVVSFDRELRVTSINSAAERMLLVSADDGVGKLFDEIFNRKISELIRNNESLNREEVIYESPSHSRLWLGLTISPLKDSKGESIGKIIIFTDLTDLKALESQVRLRENLSSLGEMSAGIAHELRNPMGVIAGYTKILSRKVSDDLKENVEAINKEIEMMDRIISDFMSFAHPLNLNKTVFDISEMLREISKSIPTGDKEIHVNYSMNKCDVEGDETLLRQVITNLFQNSIEAIRERGELSLSSEKRGSSVHIGIADTGHGISDEIRSKIFMPFYTTKEKGTGLGLAIVHKIVISHGGSISFNSSADGTAFNVILKGSS
ncbi:MAG: ATP-binding protein [Thermodesulfovibrionales bacterium]